MCLSPHNHHKYQTLCFLSDNIGFFKGERVKFYCSAYDLFSGFLAGPSTTSPVIEKREP